MGQLSACEFDRHILQFVEILIQYMDIVSKHVLLYIGQSHTDQVSHITLTIHDI